MGSAVEHGGAVAHLFEGVVVGGAGEGAVVDAGAVRLLEIGDVVGFGVARVSRTVIG